MIKINISIEADSVEEAKNAFAQLGSSAVVSSAPSGIMETPPPATAEKPKTRSTKATAAEPARPEAVVVPMNTADPLAAAPTAAPAGDPLAATTPTQTPAADPLGAAAPAGDPLGGTAPAADPLAATAATTTTAPAATAAKPSVISLQTIREKIGTLNEKKQQCKDLIATYKKADGTPCEKPSDLQESDYESVYNDLDYI